MPGMSEERGRLASHGGVAVWEAGGVRGLAINEPHHFYYRPHALCNSSEHLKTLQEYRAMALLRNPSESWLSSSRFPQYHPKVTSSTQAPLRTRTRGTDIVVYIAHSILI